MWFHLQLSAQLATYHKTLNNFMTYNLLFFRRLFFGSAFLGRIINETLNAKNKLKSKLICIKREKNKLKTLFSRKIDFESALIFSRSEMLWIFVV